MSLEFIAGVQHLGVAGRRGERVLQGEKSGENIIVKEVQLHRDSFLIIVTIHSAECCYQQYYPYVSTLHFDEDDRCVSDENSRRL